MPHIGRINGIHYTLGYCGHGVSIATYVGTEAGLLLAGKKPPAPSSKSPTRPTSSTATAPGSSPSPPSTTEYWIGCLKE